MGAGEGDGEERYHRATPGESPEASTHRSSEKLRSKESIAPGILAQALCSSDGQSGWKKQRCLTAKGGVVQRRRQA